MTLAVRKDRYQHTAALPSLYLFRQLEISSFSLTDQALFTLRETFSLAGSDPGSKAYLQHLSTKFHQTFLDALISQGSRPLTAKHTGVYEHSVRRVTQQMYDIFKRAGIKSFQTFDVKASRLNEIKKQALCSYFSSGGRKAKQQLDQAMGEAAGIWEPDTQAAVASYWNLLLSDPWAAERHESLEQDLLELFVQKLNDAHQNMRALKGHQITSNFGLTLKRNFANSFKFLVKSWEEKRRKTKMESDRITLDYILFKGRLWFKPVMKKFLREILEPMISQAHQEIHELAKKIRQENTQLHFFFLRELNSCRCSTDRERLIKEAGPFSEEYVEAVLLHNANYRKQCLRKIMEVEKFTENDCLRSARLKWGFKDQDLQEALPYETPYDMIVGPLASLRLAEGKDDIFLDLDSLADPIAYFAQRLEERDKKILALLQPLVPQNLLESSQPFGAASLESPVEEQDGQA